MPPYPGPQAPTAPYPYPAYYPPPPRTDSSKTIVIIIVVVIVVVVVIAAVAAVLYVTVSGLIGGPPAPRIMTVSVSSSLDGANWTVLFQSVPSDVMPASTSLLIRNVQGVIVLQQTSFLWLDWSADHAVYHDAAPAVTAVRSGDSLLISRAWYPVGSVIQISDTSVLAVATLQ